MKLNKLTIQDPGHSSRGSGSAVVVGGCVVVGGGLLVVGLVFAATFVLSQHTDPLLQLDVLDTKTKKGEFYEKFFLVHRLSKKF